jgi:hypothetical protein
MHKKTVIIFFYRELQLKLKVRGNGVICNFLKHYTSNLQDENENFHWNSAQATIHPFVIYYSENEKTEHISFIVITDSLKHYTVVVHLFHGKLCMCFCDKFKYTQFSQ